MVDPRLLVAVPSSPDLIDGLARWLPDVPYIRPDKLGDKPWPSIEAVFVANVDREMPSLRPVQVPRLRFVQFLFTGLDGFPFHRFAPEVQVASNRGAYGPFVAEHAVALALALSKNVGRGQEMVLDGKMRPAPSSMFLDGRRAVILGFGRIGHETARRLRGLGMSIEGISRTGNADPGADQMTSIAHLSEALSRADLIVNCLPLTPSTRGIIGSEELGQLKPEAILVNVGRAATIDEDALVTYVKGHPDLRFGSDVWWDEDFVHGKVEVPPALKDLPNLLGTPHTAGLTADSRKFVLDNALQNVARYFHGERPQYLADQEDRAMGEPAP
jgi:phosphoglycerate dehydrogenase-like enzyme